MTQVQLTIRSSGHCFAEGHHVMKGAPKTPVRFEAIWAEIDHPTQGKILYDTGYTWRFLDATQRFPQRIYAKLTKVSILPEEEAHRQQHAEDLVRKMEQEERDIIERLESTQDIQRSAYQELQSTLLQS